MSDLPLLIYDSSRLLSRAEAETPTGIDRVVVNYLLYFADHPGYQLLCIEYKKGFVRTLNQFEVSALLRRLVPKWVPSHAPDWSDVARSVTNYLQLPTSRGLLVAKDSDAAVVYSGEFRALVSAPATRRIYLNAAHQGLHDSAYIRAMKHSIGAECVLFIHDLIPVTYPEFTRASEMVRGMQRINTAVQQADLIVVNSRRTESELVGYAEQGGMACPETLPLYIGVEPTVNHEDCDWRVLTGADNYFVVLGTIEPRKNHLMLLNLWRSFVESEMENIPRLIIIGKRGWCNENTFAMLDRCEKIAPYVIELSDLDDAHVSTLLRHCRALLFPSFVEGWGMPLLEALALQVPAICSDLPVFREAAGDYPTFIDPLDEKGWGEAICKADKRTDTESVNLPRWEDHFEGLRVGLEQIQARPNIDNPLRPATISEGIRFFARYRAAAALRTILPEALVRRFLVFRATPVAVMQGARIGVIRRLGRFLAKG